MAVVLGVKKNNNNNNNNFANNTTLLVTTYKCKSASHMYNKENLHLDFHSF